MQIGISGNVLMQTFWTFYTSSVQYSWKGSTRRWKVNQKEIHQTGSTSIFLKLFWTYSVFQEFSYWNQITFKVAPSTVHKILKKGKWNIRIFSIFNTMECHYATFVRAYLDEVFPNRWISRRGMVELPSRSPDLTPLKYFVIILRK